MVGESTARTWRSTYESHEQSIMATLATHMRQSVARSSARTEIRVAVESITLSARIRTHFSSALCARGADKTQPGVGLRDRQTDPWPVPSLPRLVPMLLRCLRDSAARSIVRRHRSARRAFSRDVRTPLRCVAVAVNPVSHVRAGRLFRRRLRPGAGRPLPFRPKSLSSRLSVKIRPGSHRGSADFRSAFPAG
jgi:hypothetical protein